jgi:hypothetical protein
MKLRKLTIGTTLTIATLGIQSAAWSSTPNSANYEVPTEIRQELQPGTSGGADSQSLDATSKDSSRPQQPTGLNRSADSAEPGKNMNIGMYGSRSCQFLPQTTGGAALKQLNSLSGCDLGN